MKKLILATPLTALLFGCISDEIKHSKSCFLTVRNGSGWSSGSSVVECDSFQMHGIKKATIWVNGHKMNIEAETVIYPHVK